MRPLTLADVRLSPGGTVVAAPAWAYEPSRAGPCDYWPIKPLWGPLKKVLRRRREKREAAREAQREHYRSVVGDSGKTEAQHGWAASWLANDGAPDPTAGRGKPSLAFPTVAAKKVCRACGQPFFGLGAVTACTDRCARARRACTRTRGKTAERRPGYPIFISCTVHSVQPLGGAEQVRGSAAFASAL
jgi:hypothetical protein